jgi:outer membrane protein insertion porin family/translocation and assembly module TamA
MRFQKLVLLAAALVLGGCKTIPEGRSSVDAVAVRGAVHEDAGDIEDKIATTPSPKFLGLFRGILYEYSVFDRFLLQRDLARIEAFYRARGFWDAHVRAGRVRKVDDRHVEIEILVEEGKPVVTRNVRIVGMEHVPRALYDVAKRDADLELPRDLPFDEDKFERASGAVLRALTDRGYAYAKVKKDAAVDLVRHGADIVFDVTPGDTCVFGAVRVEGLGKLPEAPVLRATDIREGKPYSQAVVESAQQAILDLGVFASVGVTPELPDPPRPDHVVPIVVKVEPSRLRTIRLGGGIEFDALKTDIHGLVGWEDRNFLGGMRMFSVQLRPGVVLYPLRINNITAPNHLLPEERLRVELRQPGFIEARTNGFIRPNLDTYPVLINPNPPSDAPVLGYIEAHASAGVDRTLHKLYGAFSENVQYDVPFSYIGRKDPTLEKLLISYPELYLALDFRDDRVHPKKGIFVANTLQVAGGPFGGDAADLKIQPDARGYVPVMRGVVFAARASVGFLFPRNYGDVVRAPPSTFDTTAEQTHDYQLTFFRGFFSGGPTTNRGYPVRGVSPHAVVPFLSPAVAAQNFNAGCGEQCRTPTGGFTLWEASTELRFKVTGALSVATFCDASDVSPQVTNIRLMHLHLSCGPGARYDTPVGPVRLDIGWRLPGLQVLGGLTPDEQAPDTFVFGIPIAVAIGIGEAY